MTGAAEVVADTHVFIWYVQGSPRLPETTRAVLDVATAADLPILISAVTLVELRYLVEKGTFSETEFAGFIEVLDAEDSSFEVVPVDGDVARAVSDIPRKLAKDPFDRMIAATALARGQTLVTHDWRLQQLSAPRVVW